MLAHDCSTISRNASNCGAVARSDTHVDESARRERAHRVANGDAADIEALRQRSLGAEPFTRFQAFRIERVQNLGRDIFRGAELTGCRAACHGCSSELRSVTMNASRRWRKSPTRFAN